MADKYIKQYTEATTPNSTDALLIDQGLGEYKYVTIANLLKGNTSIPIGTTFRLTVDGLSCFLEYSADNFVTEPTARWSLGTVE